MTRLADDHAAHWDQKFQTRSWGKYPAEDIIRFVSRRFDPAQRGSVSVLDLGSGPGANTWFLCREGFQVSCIDHSELAIAQLTARIEADPLVVGCLVDAIVSDFSKMPFDDASFNLVIDHVSICANTIGIIDNTIREIFRILKPGGIVYSKFISDRTTGVTEGRRLEPNTYVDNPRGPTVDIGPVHVVDEDRFRDLFATFEIVAVDRYFRTDSLAGYEIEEFVLVGSKPYDS